ncbi:4-aminobutyrate--2-oxoglutarate transaminase [Desulforamulus hydrothermalis]|uniref:4-aminobutyrate aminotransferase n=1 Tax=Desulforamulus hydrothermalis Lam5 = DSM 18033 TaxID=1121428 RepID=K8DXU1_9FIRM|nr:4-aminobutyrate--2-oxoglutarate transaminase [Desulforamulus hydrothermalis]CCO07410.1 putative 4-aminobutyrate aminotransferase [Desulforamulus hydrothermalis Lam5 = DSM 18033]SHH36352.1 4-aminobutyrate aminotransferase / (S)-3-amino-2-methylpropionate transaminase [Desulforamulus hydrothermalis Lam5 = DSM 18033]
MTRLKTDIPGPQSAQLLEKRRQYVARGVGNTGKFFVDRAKGALITDVDGNILIDFACGIGVTNVGHCPDDVIEAVKEQLAKYLHPCFHVSMYEPYVNLAEKLVSLTPGEYPKKAMFANSGAEAVENAVKIARKYTGKTGIISLECGFHGRTLMAMTLTSKVKPYKYGFGPFAPDVYKIPSAYCYRCYYGLQYPGCGLRCLEQLERFFTAECPADKIAAVIAEPVQGEGGFIVPPPEFLPGLQAICQENDIVFIADEVQTGFGRTGKMFACEHYDLQPDLMTLSKAIAAGFPISAVVGRADVMDAPNPGEIGGTYGGNPIACTAALAVIDKIQREDLCARANCIGAQIKERLKDMQEKFPAIGDVRGLGAMVAVEFVKDRQTREPDQELTARLVAECYKRGLVVLAAGIFSNVLRFLPPLVMTDGQLNEALDILEESLTSAVNQK